MNDAIRTLQTSQEAAVGGVSRKTLSAGGAEAGQGGVSERTRLADGTFERRHPLQRVGKPKGPSIFRAVRKKCLDCAAGSQKYIRFCPSDGLHSRRCPLWPFRFGVRPETARKRYGANLLDPEAMPDASTNLDDLR